MKVNGIQVDPTELSILDYLQEQGYSPQHVVVERNRDILVYSQFASSFFQEHDEVNILQFMGGG